MRGSSSEWECVTELMTSPPMLISSPDPGLAPACPASRVSASRCLGAPVPGMRHRPMVRRLPQAEMQQDRILHETEHFLYRPKTWIIRNNSSIASQLRFTSFCCNTTLIQYYISRWLAASHSVLLVRSSQGRRQIGFSPYGNATSNWHSLVSLSSLLLLLVSNYTSPHSSSD